jgi:hypothetical protein
MTSQDLLVSALVPSVDKFHKAILCISNLSMAAEWLVTGGTTGGQYPHTAAQTKKESTIARGSFYAADSW